MAEVGKKTGKQTQAGRDVYETPEGEMVSEKSTTFEYKGKWINIPTIHGGKQYSEDQLMEMLDKGLIKPTSTHDELEEAIQAAQSRSDSLEFNKGGTPMLEKQMELFEDGGLRDEGGMVDEESGNEVPIGSTRKEVRDDIPAMLSEGEFVFPADVVRYIGLENLMRIRQDAKQGLKQMEAMGQMGNGDEAVLPDDMPFGMMDLIIIEGEEEEEPQEKAHGGVIHAQQGTFVTPMFDPSNQDVREYKNEAGDSLFIPFLGGEPVYPIPAGYFPAGQMPDKTETEEAIPTGGDDDDTPPPPQSEFQKAGGFGMDTSATDGKALDMWIKEAEKVSTFGNVAAGIGAAINPLIGGMIAMSNKRQKKEIIDMLDEKIAQARKTPIKGQVAALQDIKKRLTTKEGKGILGKVIDEITGTVTNALGLSNEEKVVAKVGASANTNQSPNEPDSTTEQATNKVNQTTTLLKAAGINPETVDSEAFGKSLGRAVAKLGANASAEDLANEIKETYKADAAGSTLKEDGTYDISSWFTDAPAVDIETLSPTEQAIEDARDRPTVSTETLSPTEQAIQDARMDMPYDSRTMSATEKAIQDGRIRETTGTALETDAMSDFAPWAVRDQGDKLFYNNFRQFDNADAAKIIAKQQEEGTQTLTVPEDQTTAAFGPVAVEAPVGSTTSTAVQELRDYVGNLRSPVSITGRSMYEKFDPRTTLEELTNKLSQSTGRGRGRDDEPTAPTTPAPTAYVPGQQRRKSRKDKDDKPSFAGEPSGSMADLAASAKEASKDVKTTVQKDASGNVTGVTTTGGTAEQQKTMEDYVTSAAAGAKGGLFTRRKKKKK